jgi:hypothetical protein
LRSIQSQLREDNKKLTQSFAQASDELNILSKEKEVQDRKSKSLILLVSDIQRQVDDYYSTGIIEENEETLTG